MSKLPPDVIQSIDDTIAYLHTLKDSDINKFGHLILSTNMMGEDPEQPNKGLSRLIMSGNPDSLLYGVAQVLANGHETLPDFTEGLIHAAAHVAAQQATQENVRENSVKYFGDDGETLSKEQLSIPEPTSTRKH